MSLAIGLSQNEDADYDFLVKINNEAVDISGYTAATFLVKVNVSDPDAEALLSKVKDAGISLPGEIGMLRVHIDDSDFSTVSMPADKDKRALLYGLRISCDAVGGDRVLVRSATLVLRRAVTHEI